MVLKGGGRGPTKLGVVPLSDRAGEVAAIGEEATRVKTGGDRIAGCFHPRWFGGPIKPDYLIDRLGANLDGVLAQYAVFSEEALVPMPSHLSFCGGLYPAMRRSDRLDSADQTPSSDRRRDSIDGGSGCFGLYATIRPAFGRPSDRDDLDRGKGRTEVINYAKNSDWDSSAN
jgi:hypothetical protein